MAQAASAWSRPTLDISSWSCMGPRRRPAAAANMMLPEQPSSTTETTARALELPVSSSDETNVSGSRSADVAGTHEDRMTEFELWEQLEHELYEHSEGEEADVAKEMREEEEAAKVSPENSAPDTKEAHRFFPAGKIMHIVTAPEVVEERENIATSSSETDDDKDDDEVVEDKVGIYLAPRSLYSKIRLSHSMITDHFMPVYRRQMEKLLRELEKEDKVSLKSHNSSSEEIELVL